MVEGWCPETIKGKDALGGELDKLLNNARNQVLKHHPGSLLMDCELHVAARGPTLLPLQLFDLPGMVGLESSKTGTMREDTRRILDFYIQEPHTMMLPVVKATDDIDSLNNAILDVCWNADPGRLRTIGVLTHPDKCNSTDVSDTGRREKWIARLSASDNQEQPQQNKWHILYCMPSTGSDSRPEEADPPFDFDDPQNLWSEVPPHRRGVDALKHRIREWLFRRIREWLPAVEAAIREELRMQAPKLEKLQGTAQGLDQSVKEFKEAVDKLRRAAFVSALGDPPAEVAKGGHDAFLRGRVQDENDQFAESMRRFGRGRDSFLDLDQPEMDSDLSLIPARHEYHEPEHQQWTGKPKRFQTKEAEAKHVGALTDEARGNELRSEYSHRQVAHVFKDMSNNWKLIAMYYVGQVTSRCRRYLATVIPILFKHREILYRKGRLQGYEGFHDGESIAKAFITRHVETRLCDRERDALEELNQLDLERHEHPIIVDHEFEAASRRDKMNKMFKQVQAALHKYEALGGGGEAAKLASSVNPKLIALANGTFSQKDAHENTVDAVLFRALVVYKVVFHFHHPPLGLAALTKYHCSLQIQCRHFILNFTVQVIQRHFLRDFEDIIPRELSDNEIRELLSKDQAELVRQQKELENRQDQLNSCLKIITSY